MAGRSSNCGGGRSDSPFEARMGALQTVGGAETLSEVRCDLLSGGKWGVLALWQDLLKPSIISMPQGTTEQNQQVRHRRRVFSIVSVVLPVSCFLGAITLSCLLDEKTFFLILFIGGFILGVAGLIFTASYYRCPVCKQAFTRGTTDRGHKHCENCHTTFGDQARADLRKSIGHDE